MSTTTSPEKTVSIYDFFHFDQQKELDPINLTLGNPNVKPPALYYKVMHEIIHELEHSEWNGHGYIIDKDPFGLCNKIAEHLSLTYKKPFNANDVCITVGATGALDVILKTVLDNSHQNSPTKSLNEVIVIAPYFVEYINLIEANGGMPVVVDSDDNFGLDIEAITNAITPYTKAIIINSPNNPTGRVYQEHDLLQLAKILHSNNDKYGIQIKVIEDAVYDTLIFTNTTAPSLIEHYQYLFRVNSYSKSISLSGERIGYFAIHPNIGNDAFKNTLLSTLHLNLRMRVVHAPLLQHRILARLPVNCVTDSNYYKKNIDTLYSCLTTLGFNVGKPEGTFYLWATLPKRYNGEAIFRQEAQRGATPLLYLPGILFGGGLYKNCVRFSACVSYETILRACEKLILIDKCL